VLSTLVAWLRLVRIIDVIYHIKIEAGDREIGDRTSGVG
jgi:hypothetical protein